MEFKNIKISYKTLFSNNFIKNFVIYSVLTFAILVIVGVIAHYNNIAIRERRELESKYKIEKDAVKLMHWSVVRAKTLQYILSDNSFLINYIKHKELKYYKEIQNKLPANDLFLDYMKYNMYYLSGIMSDNHSKEFDKSLVKFLKKIKNKTSVINAIDQTIKFDFITTIADHIAWGFYKKDERILDFLERYLLSLINNISKTQLSTYDRINKNYLYFLLNATLVSINKRQSLNSKEILNITICYNAPYIKWKNRVLTAYSYIERMQVQYNKSNYIDARINNTKREKNELDKIEKNYCQKESLLKH